MYKKIIVASSSWKNIPGNLVLEVEDIAPADWANQKTKTGTPMHSQPKTISGWKQHFGSSSGQLVHPVGKQSFTFDLSPWNNVDQNRYLKLEWSFQPDHPIPPTDPRYPQRSGK